MTVIRCCAIMGDMIAKPFSRFLELLALIAGSITYLISVLIVNYFKRSCQLNRRFGLINFLPDSEKDAGTKQTTA